MDTNSLKKQWKMYGNIENSDKHECFYCGGFLNSYNRTVDHIIPKSKGGILSNDNKVFACKRCNQFKSDMLPDELLAMARFIEKEFDREHEEKMGYYRRLTSRLDKMIKNAKGKKNS